MPYHSLIACQCGMEYVHAAKGILRARIDHKTSRHKIAERLPFSALGTNAIIVPVAVWEIIVRAWGAPLWRLSI